MIHVVVVLTVNDECYDSNLISANTSRVGFMFIIIHVIHGPATERCLSSPSFYFPQIGTVTPTGLKEGVTAPYHVYICIYVRQLVDEMS
jgi:hypothetical protein